MSRAPSPRIDGAKAAWENGYVQLESFKRSVQKNWHRLRRCGVEAELTPGRRVLDLCCGWGSTLVSLNAHRLDAIGLDLSPALLRRAQEHGLTRLVCADTTALPFRPNAFDIVTVQGGLHHLWFDQFERALVEIDRVLKPGGYFAFSEPCNTWMLRLYIALMHSPLSSYLTTYMRNWRTTFEHERDTYFHWLGAQRKAIDVIAARMELLRLHRGLVTMFGLARSCKPLSANGRAVP